MWGTGRAGRCKCKDNTGENAMEDEILKKKGNENGKEDEVREKESNERTKDTRKRDLCQSKFNILKVGVCCWWWSGGKEPIWRLLFGFVKSENPRQGKKKN